MGMPKSAAHDVFEAVCTGRIRREERESSARGNSPPGSPWRATITLPVGRTRTPAGPADLLAPRSRTRTPGHLRSRLASAAVPCATAPRGRRLNSLRSFGTVDCYPAIRVAKRVLAFSADGGIQGTSELVSAVEQAQPVPSKGAGEYFTIPVVLDGD